MYSDLHDQNYKDNTPSKTDVTTFGSVDISKVRHFLRKAVFGSSLEPEIMEIMNFSSVFSWYFSFQPQSHNN